MIGIRITGVNTTTEACLNVLRTAVEAGHTHGIGYWADVLGLEDDGTLTLIDRESDSDMKFLITPLQVADAIHKMATDPPGTQSMGWMSRLLDDDHPDGPLADVIVQVACHGKVLYG